jgi:hypothetical protein
MLIEADDSKVTEWAGRKMIACTKELIESVQPFGIAELYQVTDSKAFKAFQKQARAWRK